MVALAVIKEEVPLRCQCCGRNVLAVINKEGELVVTKRGHKLVVPLQQSIDLNEK